MSIEFNDSSSEYLYFNERAFLTAAPISMACWFRSDDLSVHKGLISICKGSSDVNYFLLWALSTTSGQTVRADTRSVAGSAVATSASQYSNLTWHHAGAVFASASSRIAYLDGAAGSENTTSRTPSGLNRNAVGCVYRSTIGSYMSGRIAEAAIWSTALSADDFAALAKGYAPSLIKPESLVVYAPLHRPLASSNKYPIYFWDVSGDPVTLTENSSPSAAVHPHIIIPPVQRRSVVLEPAGSVGPRAMNHYRRLRVA